MPVAAESAFQRLLDRIEQLGAITESPSTGLTRTFGSGAMREANQLVRDWMREAGLDAGVDVWGNLIGRSRTNTGRVLVVGSHLDTVRNAGKYDGALGVLLGLAAWESLDARPPGYDIVLVGFSDEEGVRFHSTYLGSRGLTGEITTDELKQKDHQGITLGEALGAFANEPFLAWEADEEWIGYIEAHIEQGPVLESLGLPLGVVSAIASQSRHEVRVRGRAAHAGTTPPALRRDALAGAAEMILRIEKMMSDVPELRCTVGNLEVDSSSSNVIPGSVRFTVDLRHPFTQFGEEATKLLFHDLEKIAGRRGLICQFQTVQKSAAATMNPFLSNLLHECIENPDAPFLASGAGHDALVLSRHCPAAMLFVRCREGLSHHPEESVEPGDVKAALETMTRFLRRVGDRGEPR